jgi:hypothetical protein
VIILFWQSQSHGASIFTHLVRDDKSNGRVVARYAHFSIPAMCSSC